ncbi:hypothetical protein FSP39_017547 [Pinctada imbricata]|uniref:Uncharacterized protein n=1 Tax=Pinctada imbricata TaxID=66713 RepID=A0AA89CC84_PINIB|nr:hypothetical protein FSP39_017547 [Pinctada imbricata]
MPANLFNDIFANYDKRIRPIDDQSQPVTLKVSYYLNSINELNAITETLTTSGYLILQWKDSGLAWNPSDYNNITRTYIPQDDVWKPDFVLQNGKAKIKELGGDFYYVSVSHNGLVTWYPYEVFTTKCSIDMTYYPYDVQSCDMKFTVWSYRAEDVNVSSKTAFRLTYFERSHIWDVKSTNAQVSVYDGGYVIVLYRLVLQRKPAFFILNILFPIALISFIMNIVFIIPTVSGSKIGFSVTIFLTFAVFLTVVSSQLPTNSENTAIISTYIVVEISFSVLMLLVSALSSKTAAPWGRKDS